MSTAVVLAEDAALRSALFAFRHKIYVDELRGHTLRDSAGELADTLDDVALNYVVLARNRVIGSLRVTDWCKLPSADALAAKYGVASIVERAGANAVCHGGRLAVERSARGGSALVDVLSRAVLDSLERGIRFVVSDCSAELFPLYAKLGYVRTGCDFVDPDFGPKWSMIWPLGDHARMRKTGSALLPIVTAFEEDAEGAEWVRRAFSADEAVQSDRGAAA
jgi:hypothetical protein